MGIAGGRIPLLGQGVLEPRVLRADERDINIDALVEDSEAEREVIARAELVREPADAGELLADWRSVARHHPQSAPEPLDSGLNRRAERGVLLLAVAVWDLAGVDGLPPRALLALLARHAGTYFRTRYLRATGAAGQSA